MNEETPIVDEDDDFEIGPGNPEVRLGYNSYENVSFGGTVGTGFSRKEWDTLDEKTKDQVIEEALYELVEIFELDDDEPDYDTYSRWSR